MAVKFKISQELCIYHQGMQKLKHHHGSYHCPALVLTSYLVHEKKNSRSMSQPVIRQGFYLLLFSVNSYQAYANMWQLTTNSFKL